MTRPGVRRIATHLWHPMFRHPCLVKQRTEASCSWLLMVVCAGPLRRSRRRCWAPGCSQTTSSRTWWQVRRQRQQELGGCAGGRLGETWGPAQHVACRPVARVEGCRAPAHHAAHQAALGQLIAAALMAVHLCSGPEPGSPPWPALSSTRDALLVYGHSLTRLHAPLTGLGAGFFAVCIGSPVDVVKSRIMGGCPPAGAMWPKRGVLAPDTLVARSP